MNHHGWALACALPGPADPSARVLHATDCRVADPAAAWGAMVQQGQPVQRPACAGWWSCGSASGFSGTEASSK
eukprot:5225776-Alexandrium_andersonii.AAC.1